MVRQKRLQLDRLGARRLVAHVHPNHERIGRFQNNRRIAVRFDLQFASTDSAGRFSSKQCKISPDCPNRCATSTSRCRPQSTKCSDRSRRNAQTAPATTPNWSASDRLDRAKPTRRSLAASDCAMLLADCADARVHNLAHAHHIIRMLGHKLLQLQRLRSRAFVTNLQHHKIAIRRNHVHLVALSGI